MSRRGITRLAWGLWVLAVAFVASGPGLVTALEWDGPITLSITVGFAAVQLGAASAGAVIVSRLPENTVGWIFLALGTGIGFWISCWSWSRLGLETSYGPLPGDEVAAWLGSWLFVPVVVGLSVFLLLVFPDGRFLSQGWRRAGVAIGALVAIGSLTTAFRPGRIDPGIPNPLAPGGWVGEAIVVLDDVGTPLALPGMLLATAGLVVRLRRSRGVERQQLKWFTYTAALVGAGFAGAIVADGTWGGEVLFQVGLLALASLPVAAGIAILRHRLYDIDVVINRTLVYGALSAALAATYASLVLVLQLTLSPLTEDSGLAIAGSTLAVAALFRPARTRIQAAVDRRFYRRKFDAARTLERFGAHLRDEVALDSLTAELRAVVADTMQPSHVSLWLRDRNAFRTPAA